MKVTVIWHYESFNVTTTTTTTNSTNTTTTTAATDDDVIAGNVVKVTRTSASIEAATGLRCKLLKSKLQPQETQRAKRIPLQFW